MRALHAAHARADRVIVVDDGSTDGTTDALRAAYPDVEVVRLTTSAGFTRAVNQGWAMAASEIVLLLNSDTEVAPDALARVREAFERDPRLGIAGATLRFPDGRPQWSAGPSPTPVWLFGAASGLPAALARVPGVRRVRPERQGDGPVPWVPATAMAVRRAVVDEIGRFDETYALYAQDLAYCVAASARGWRVAVVPDVVVHHLRGGTVGAVSGDGQVDIVAMSRDLDAWLQRHGTPRQRAAWRLGLRARLCGRAVAGLVRMPSDRAAWRATSARYREALRAIAPR